MFGVDNRIEISEYEEGSVLMLQNGRAEDSPEVFNLFLVICHFLQAFLLLFWRLVRANNVSIL
jgi:hypothetical protein